MTTATKTDPRYHTQRIQDALDAIIKHLRENVMEVDEPQAKALFETSAEVLIGLKKAYAHYEKESEQAWTT